MSESPKVYLSEISGIFEHTLSTLDTYGSAYLSAPCGSGKTQFAKNIIHKFQYHTECDYNQIIFLIDTINGLDQLLESDTELFSKDHTNWNRSMHAQVVTSSGGFVASMEGLDDVPQGVLVLTYARFIQIIKQFTALELEEFYSTIKLIIADEPHRLTDFAKWSNGNARVQSELVYVKNLIFNRPHYNPSQFKLIAMSATFSESDMESIPPIQRIDTSAAIGWTTDSTLFIKDLRIAISHVSSLKAQSKPYRTVVYASLIRNMQSYEEQFTEAGFNCACVWSLHSSKHMTPHQKAVREHIVKHHTIPEGIEVLIINASTETSVNLNNSDLNVFISMIATKSNVVQARGRIRRDISMAFIYDSTNGLTASEFKELTQSTIRETLPDAYLNVDISKDQLIALATQVNLRGSNNALLKWPSIKAHYEELGYICTSSRKQINGVRDTYYKFTT